MCNAVFTEILKRPTTQVLSWFFQELIFLCALPSSLIAIGIRFVFFKKGDDYCHDDSAYLTCENKSCAWSFQCHFGNTKLDQIEL